MILSKPLFRFKDFKYLHKKQKIDFQLTNYKNYYWYKSGAEALSSIIFKEISNYKKDEVVILLPAYFCGQTLRFIRSMNLKIFFYEINKSFKPIYEKIDLKINDFKKIFFVHVHYFGKINSQIESRKFCDQISATLIEDCAHIISPVIRKKWVGEYLLFSPHKHYSVPSIGLVITNNELNFKKNNSFEFIWFLKQLYYTFFKKSHYSKYKDVWTSTLENFEISYVSSININLTIRHINNYDKYKSQILSNWYKVNSKILLIDKWKPIYKSINDFTPYLYGVLCDSKEIAVKRYNFLNKKNQICLLWPDIPYEIKLHKSFNNQVLSLRRRILFFFIHQDVPVESLTNRINELSKYLK